MMVQQERKIQNDCERNCEQIANAAANGTWGFQEDDSKQAVAEILN